MDHSTESHRDRATDPATQPTPDAPEGPSRPASGAAESAAGQDSTGPGEPGSSHAGPGDASRGTAGRPIRRKAHRPRGSLEPGLEKPSPERPGFVFFGVVAAVSLLADVGTKAWAEIALGSRPFSDSGVMLVDHHLTLVLAYNRGGAWGLLQDASEQVRTPFFLLVSVLAIGFIVSLYRRLASGQTALKWGLPLVLGGALGNLQDRIVRGSVVDFIDYRADWVRSMNALIRRIASEWTITDHWPTFNVADIVICIGVGLMAIDMFTAKRQAPQPEPEAR
jgi:signal peptidase II